MTLSTRASDRIAAVSLAAAVLALYGWGACRTIYAGDSGELVTAAALLGIPHPSGYPLYVLLGKLWISIVPLISIAARMSLFSAICAAAACGVAYWICRAHGMHPVAGFFSATLLAFGESFWSEANIQRVYALNALFLMTVTAMVWKWSRVRDVRLLAMAFFLCGLGASNHTFMVICGGALPVFAVVQEPSLLRRGKVIAGCALAFCAGLLPYLYLPLRSRADPLLDWGDPETLGRFLDVVSRRRFWENAWIEGPADLIPIVSDYLRSLGSELTWIGAALAVGGLVVALARPAMKRVVLFPLLVMAGNLVAVAIHGSRTDIFIWHRYYIPSYAMAALLAGLGCDALVRALPRMARAGPLLVPAVMLVSGWSAHDRSRYAIAEDYSKMVLASLPPGAHLIASDDNILFPLIYLHLVEKMRPDVDLILQEAGGGPPPPLRFNPDEDAVYFTHHPNWEMPGLEIVPVGLVFRAWRADSAAPRAVVPRFSLEGEHDARVPKDYLTSNLLGQFHYMLGVTLAGTDWTRARAELEAAQRAAPLNDVLFYNLGLLYRGLGLFDEGMEAFQRSSDINPRSLASHERPRAADKLAERERLAREEARISGDTSLRALARGSSGWHRRMADLLGQRGETVAARGHLLKALGADGEPR